MKISVTEFKAKCLALMERVKTSGESITVTKRDVPIAEVVPVRLAGARTPQDELKGTVHVRGDILDPVLPPADWEAEAGTASSPGHKGKKARRRRGPGAGKP